MSVIAEPYDLVADLLPFPLYPFQVDAVNGLAFLQRTGLYFEAGLGKTPTAAAIALYKLRAGDIDRAIVLMPPVLIPQWARFLAKIPGTTVTMYRGSPAKRKALDLNATFILMGYDIFRVDYDQLCERVTGTMLLIADEAQAMKNLGTKIHRLFRDFTMTSHRLLLSGTPISSPADGYGMISLVSPGIYRNLDQFERIHIFSRDSFGKPTVWWNLDLLNENLAINTIRALKEDVIKDMPAVTYQEVSYELHAAHLKLYQRMCNEHIAKLPDGGKIDLISASALFHALARIPLNAEHFSGDTIKSTGVDVLEEVLVELGGRKLVVFTKYRMTNRKLVEQFQSHGAVAIFGETSASEKQENLERFISDKQCRLLILQTVSGGVGIDGLQDVCSDVLFLELPDTSSHFLQAVGRLHRVGQKAPVTVRIALAEKTLQRRVWDMVQEKDSLVNLCVRGFANLRDALEGK